jgi:stage II sporulation protein B
MEIDKDSQTKMSGPVIVVKTKRSTTGKQLHINQVKEDASTAKMREQPSRQTTRSKNWIAAARRFSFKKVFSFAENKQKRIIQWRSPHNPFLQKRKWARRSQSPNIKQLLLSIGGAILVGAVMGFSILNLFFADSSTFHSSKSIDDHLPHPLSAQSVPKQGNPPAPSATIASSLPRLEVVLLQAGNFEERSGAQKMLQSYQTHGLAAVMSDQSPYRVFLGIGLNRDDALKLSSIYQKQDIHVYLKELGIEGSAATLSQTDRKKLSTMIQTGNQLVQALGLLSVRDIHTNTRQGANPFAFQPNFTQSYRQWVTDGQALEASLPAGARAPLTDMTRALDQAIQSGQEAQKHPSQALLWQIQAGLVRYVVAYERLVQEIK